MLCVEQCRFRKRCLGLAEPILRQGQLGGGNTPVYNALPDPLFERRVAFRRQIPLVRIHGGRMCKSDSVRDKAE